MLRTFPSLTDPSGILMGLLYCGSSALLGVWYYWVADMFTKLEFGPSFSKEITRLIKRIGAFYLFLVIATLVSSVLAYLPSHSQTTPILTESPQVLGEPVQIFTLGFSFLGLNFNGISTEPLAGAILLFLIAWIMDEGQKMQEEQSMII